MGVGGVEEDGLWIVWGDGLNARVKRCVKKCICQGGRTQIRPEGLASWTCMDFYFRRELEMHKHLTLLHLVWFRGFKLFTFDGF